MKKEPWRLCQGSSCLRILFIFGCAFRFAFQRGKGVLNGRGDGYAHNAEVFDDAQTVVCNKEQNHGVARQLGAGVGIHPARNQHAEKNCHFAQKPLKAGVAFKRAVCAFGAFLPYQRA